MGREGRWQAAEGGWDFEIRGLNVDWLEPKRELLTALPPGLQKLIERLQPSGSFAIYDSSLRLAKRPNAAKLASAWNVNLDCHQAALSGALPLTNIFGSVQLIGQADDKTCITAGELAIRSMSWKGTQLTSVHGPLWTDASVCLFGEPAAAQQNRAPQPITADVYGGSLTANIRLDHGINSSFRVSMAIGGADLGRFANERLGGAKDLSGKISGKVWLAGTGQSTRTLQGAGEMHLVEGNLYELPVVVSLLKVLKNRAPNTTAGRRRQFVRRGKDKFRPQA
jgi:hypothetical protein